MKLTRSDIELDIPTGVSLLATLENAGINIPNMCPKGICGECKVSLLDGKRLHREIDLYLSEQEKAANDTMMCCVSRSHDQELGLDL